MVTSVPYLTTRAARALTRRPGKPALIPPRLSPTRSPSSCLYAASSLNSSYPSPPPSPSSSFSSALHCAPSRRLLHSSPSNPSYPSPSPPTIFALATPPGKAGVAVIRVSGPAVPEVYRRIVFRKNQNSSVGDVRLPEPRKMVLREIRIPEGLEEDGEEVGEVIDEGLVVYFKAGSSFTSQPLLELHLHSSLSVLSRTLSVLSQLSSHSSYTFLNLPLRPAERGEFTRQAFLSGRMDLTEVEGLRDLIEAETEGQRKLARSMVGGSFRARYESLRTDIIHAMAVSEALIDFGEDDNIGEEVFEDARNQVKALVKRIENHLDDNRRGEIMRSGLKVAIFGPPNAGKSSLMNHLAHRDAAIVSPVPGTTRDVVTVSLDLGGSKVILSDTAGLRETEDEVEKIGVGRAGEEVLSSPLQILVLPLPSFLYPWTASSLTPTLALLKPYINPATTLLLLNQSDLLPPTSEAQGLAERVAKDWQEVFGKGIRWWKGSIETGEGMEGFLKGLEGAVGEQIGSMSSNTEPPMITNARHRHHLEQALLHLQTFLLQPSSNVVLAAEDLRAAAHEIGRVSGRDVGVEDVLDKLFGEFCIGK